MIPLTDDPTLAVTWSADGAWLAAAVATGGGVKTQVWVVRPDGRDARLLAGGPDQHAELGPWTRSGHRVVVTIPGAELDEPTAAYLCDPATGTRTRLASGELISVLDLSVDETYVIVKDGPRGQQFCVVVDRLGDEDHPLLPYPALGSTERAIIRPAPDGNGLVAYLATDAGSAPPPARRDPARSGRLAGRLGRPGAARGRRAGGSGRRRRRPPAAAGLEHRGRRQRGRRCWTPEPAPRVRRRTWAGW